MRALDVCCARVGKGVVLGVSSNIGVCGFAV